MISRFWLFHSNQWLNWLQLPAMALLLLLVLTGCKLGSSKRPKLAEIQGSETAAEADETQADLEIVDPFQYEEDEPHQEFQDPLVLEKWFETADEADYAEAPPNAMLAAIKRKQEFVWELQERQQNKTQKSIPAEGDTQKADAPIKNLLKVSRRQLKALIDTYLKNLRKNRTHTLERLRTAQEKSHELNEAFFAATKYSSRDRSAPTGGEPSARQGQHTDDLPEAAKTLPLLINVPLFPVRASDKVTSRAESDDSLPQDETAETQAFQQKPTEYKETKQPASSKKLSVAELLARQKELRLAQQQQNKAPREETSESVAKESDVPIKKLPEPPPPNQTHYPHSKHEDQFSDPLVETPSEDNLDLKEPKDATPYEEELLTVRKQTEPIDENSNSPILTPDQQIQQVNDFLKLNRETLLERAKILREAGAAMVSYSTEIEFEMESLKKSGISPRKKNSIQININKLNDELTIAEQNYNQAFTLTLLIYRESIDTLINHAEVKNLPYEKLEELHSIIKKQGLSIINFTVSLIDSLKERDSEQDLISELQDIQAHMALKLEALGDKIGNVESHLFNLDFCDNTSVPNCGVNSAMIRNLGGRVVAPSPDDYDEEGFQKFLEDGGVSSNSILEGYKLKSFVEATGSTHKSWAKSCHRKSSKDHPHKSLLLPVQSDWIRGLVLALFVDQLNQYLNDHDQPPIRSVISWFRSLCYHKLLHKSQGNNNAPEKSPHLTSRAFDLSFKDMQHQLTAQKFFISFLAKSDSIGLRTILLSHPWIIKEFNYAVIMKIKRKDRTGPIISQSIHFAYGSAAKSNFSFQRSYKIQSCKGVAKKYRDRCDHLRLARIKDGNRRFPEKYMAKEWADSGWETWPRDLSSPENFNSDGYRPK